MNLQPPCVSKESHREIVRCVLDLDMQSCQKISLAVIWLNSSPPKTSCLHRHNMGAAPTLLLGALCQVLLCVSAYAAGEASPVLGCKSSELLTGTLCNLLIPGIW